jgi:exodeoxyribonuclease VIII
MNKFTFDMPNDEYHSQKGVSKSGLDKIARSPAHYKYSEPKESTRAMEIGTAIHAAILEPERFDKEYCITEAKLRTAKDYKEAKAVHGGELTLTAPEAKKVLGMREAVESNLHAMRMLRSPGHAEVSAICKDPETGIMLRARYDWLSDDRIAVDVKKTQDVRPGKFARSVGDYRYHVQQAVYAFVYKQITGDDLQAFYFLAVEEEAPHSNQMYLLDDLALEMGEFYFRRDLRTYADCIYSGKWPAPDNGDGIIELPNWMVGLYENDLEVMI